MARWRQEPRRESEGSGRRKILVFGKIKRFLNFSLHSFVMLFVFLNQCKMVMLVAILNFFNSGFHTFMR